MSVFGADGEPVHSDGESVAPVCPHQRFGWSALAYMEKIMSKTKHTESREDRELSVQELETVSGGTKAQENQEQVKALETFKKALQQAGQI
jgi:hypothetical protein